VVPPENRPHRISLERATRDADVPWTIAAEIENWPLTVHHAALGVGLAIVTGCVTPSPGLVARRITDLPQVIYHAVHRRNAGEDPAWRPCSPLSAPPTPQRTPEAGAPHPPLRRTREQGDRTVGR